MATLFEQSICQNTRCFACGSIVYAVEKKITSNHIYHNRCFRCRICKRNLTGYSLNEEGDDIYCTNCYRKKQRGDCNSLEFQRAAVEKAQYVHNRHHPDQQQSSSFPRTPIFRDMTRHPSLSLRQLERHWLSHQPANINNEQSGNEFNQPSGYTSHPVTISTSFSTPIHLRKCRRDDAFANDEPSAYYSPLPTIRTETIIKPRTRQDSTEKNTTRDEQTRPTTGSATGGIEFRLNQSSIDLSNVTSPRIDRKSIIIPDLNHNAHAKQSHLRFPDLTANRRSSSVNRIMTTLRVE